MTSYHDSAKRKYKRSTSDSSWAISFSDILMIVLCFFVVFFETEENFSLIKTKIEKVVGSKSGEYPRPGTGLDITAPKHIKIAEVLKDLPVTLTISPKKEIVIDLPNNIYPIGYYSPNAEVKKITKKILDALAGFKNEIYLTVVGHTDQIPWAKKHHQRIINTDLRLGSMRAVYAAEYIIKQDILPSDSVLIAGKQSHSRDTRSLSFAIRSKEISKPKEKK